MSRHSTEPEPIPCNMINCFCMFSDYQPMTLDEWIEIDGKRRKAMDAENTLSAASLTDRDLLIILGDVGINYFGDWRDQRDKDELAMIPATILCIHGNHELRPTSPEVAELYHPIQWMGDTAYAVHLHTGDDHSDCRCDRVDHV